MKVSFDEMKVSAQYSAYKKNFNTWLREMKKIQAIQLSIIYHLAFWSPKLFI